MPEDEKGGFIVRTMAENASEAEFATDIAYLKKTWADIRDKARVSAPPTLLYQELSLGQRVLRDFVNPETTRIFIDSRENFQKLTVFAERVHARPLQPLLEHYTGQRPLFDLHGVEEEIQRALARRVELKSGGYLIIDQTEAMTTIDVNTGGFVGRAQFRRHHFQDQPRSGRQPSPANSPAQPWRHHHRRLHRHGERGA